MSILCRSQYLPFKRNFLKLVRLYKDVSMHPCMHGVGYEMSCLVRMAALTTLELALDSGGGGGGGAGGRAGPLGPLIPLAAAREDAQLALHFR